jgi:hypothetical protein
MRIKETGLFLDYLKTFQLHSTSSGGWLLTRLWKNAIVNCVSVLCCSVGKTLRENACIHQVVTDLKLYRICITQFGKFQTGGSYEEQPPDLV